MAEYINRTELIKKICDCCNGNDMVGEDGCAGFVPCRRNGWLYNMPTIDIVTCQECKWWQSNLHTVYKHYGFCTNTLCCNNAVTEANFFCKFGERE